MTRTALIFTALLLAALPAAASHPDYDDMARVQRLAHEVERAARHLHRNAEAEAHHFDRRERYALQHLHFLEEKARHFHSQVERYYQDPRHTERDFGRLWAAYSDALHTFEDLHAYGHLYRDMRSVRRPMERLARYYGYDSGYGRHDGDHRRYEPYRDRRYKPRIHFSIDWLWK